MIPVWLSFRYEIYFRTTFTLKCRCLLYRNDFILECCFPDQHACATRSSQLGYSFHTGTNLVTAFTWYRYGMWSAFIPERNFRTGTRTGVNSYRYDSYRCGISYRYHVNKYRATSGNRDELVPEWKSYRYHVNTPITVTCDKNVTFSESKLKNPPSQNDHSRQKANRWLNIISLSIRHKMHSSLVSRNMLTERVV